jgi:4-hydroxy-2-oxoheptanedioate aldolase
MQGQQIREKLLKGERIYGTHIVSLGNPVTARMITELELDFIFICTEHMPVDRTEASMMCQYYSERGISPLVRMPTPCGRLAGQYIDGGAQGIIAPYVETVEQVKELIGAVRYRPIKGEFLREILSHTRKPKEKLQRFLERFNQHLYLIIMIESVPAAENLEALVSLEGVDGVLIGPHDLSCSMEIPEDYTNPHYEKMVVDIIKRCRKLGKGVGIQTDMNAPHAQPFFDAGMNFLLHNADILALRQSFGSQLSMIRERYGDVYLKDIDDTQSVQTCIDSES